MKRNINNNILERIYHLETVEEKSFWVIAPSIAAVGLIGLTTAGLYDSALPTIASAILCLLIPIVLMLLVRKYKNYHLAYPMLCIFIGAVSVPLTFVFSGGFLSGMPLFCVVSTCISGLCYSRSWRFVALILCLLGNSAAFAYVYTNGTPFPIEGTNAIYSDIMFGYFAAGIAAFLAINLITTEVKKYRVNQDILQQYFDTEVRKEILKKADEENITLISGHRKAVILFIDISNFTTITEKMPSGQIAEFLNEFFSLAGKYIHQSGGIIDKYIGDCIMAYWFEQEGVNCVCEALKAVLDIRSDLMNNSERIYEKYNTELNFSAGISFGDVIFGDIGSDTMHDYTVIGDAVNTASRIERYAVAGETLISGNVAALAKEDFVLELVEKDIYFKGKNESINLYRVLGLGKEASENVIEQRENYGYSLYVCGCRGSFPVSGLRFAEYGGETSCYVLKMHNYGVVIDCGTGLKNAASILSDCSRIDILLTHVHYDHILGLLMSKPPRGAKVRIFANFDAWKDGRNTLNNFMERPYWPVKIEEMESISVSLGEEISLEEDIRATFYASDHPDEACVIKLMCRDRKICFYSDCEDPNKLDPEISRNSDLLFFDGMFDDADSADHEGWGHGTWQEGARFIEKQNIRKLVITHHSPETGDHILHNHEQQARDLSKNISFAKAGDRYLI